MANSPQPISAAPTPLRPTADPRPPRPGDWSPWYLTDEDDMGQSGQQYECIKLLEDSLLHLVQQRQWPGLRVGSDQFFAWIEAEPLVRLSPDVYLVPWPDDRPLPASFQVWRRGHHPPLVAFEIVSEDWRKDYDRIPLMYDQLGVKELLIFDPGAAHQIVLPGLEADQGPRRQAWQHFERDARGALTRVFAGQGGCQSGVLEVFMVVADTDLGPRPRLAFDPYGHALVPTIAEAGRQRAEAERPRAEDERQRANAERRRARIEHQRAEDEKHLKEAEVQRADVERQRADAEQQRADAERQRADAERQRAEALEAEILALRAQLSPPKPDPTQDPSG